MVGAGIGEADREEELWIEVRRAREVVGWAFRMLMPEPGGLQR